MTLESRRDVVRMIFDRPLVDWIQGQVLISKKAHQDPSMLPIYLLVLKECFGSEVLIDGLQANSLISFSIHNLQTRNPDLKMACL